MNEKLLKNKIGMQIGFLLHSDKPVEDVINDISEIASDHFKNVTSTDENPIYKREKIPDDFDPFQKILIEMKLPSGITKYIEGNIHVASKFKGYTGYCLKRIN